MRDSNHFHDAPTEIENLPVELELRWVACKKGFSRGVEAPDSRRIGFKQNVAHRHDGVSRSVHRPRLPGFAFENKGAGMANQRSAHNMATFAATSMVSLISPRARRQEQRKIAGLKSFSNHSHDTTTTRACRKMQSRLRDLVRPTTV